MVIYNTFLTPPTHCLEFYNHPYFNDKNYDPSIFWDPLAPGEKNDSPVSVINCMKYSNYFSSSFVAS